MCSVLCCVSSSLRLLARSSSLNSLSCACSHTSHAVQQSSMPAKFDDLGAALAATTYSSRPANSSNEPSCPCGMVHRFMSKETHEECRECRVVYAKACTPMATGSLCFLCFVRHAEPLLQHIAVLAQPRLCSAGHQVAARFTVPDDVFAVTPPATVQAFSVKVMHELSLAIMLLCTRVRHSIAIFGQ